MCAANLKLNRLINTFLIAASNGSKLWESFGGRDQYLEGERALARCEKYQVHT
ncbi:hypothetical protein CY34DRAFT_800145 [Suillus luteus UH-Slu-Lm8-n1]|uniref:Uncharacterized protein n=1 Tax=Suillus luteus UH-Slu-Lm8-n1 TaxID=930992 RepID=A0A0D0BKY8_9AGAM|nr:hypothetical protein CY34DRAFT_800145 [Suillus luteus UH-Slu-Lm8-n1]